MKKDSDKRACIMKNRLLKISDLFIQGETLEINIEITNILVGGSKLSCSGNPPPPPKKKCTAAFPWLQVMLHKIVIVIAVAVA